MYLIKLRKHKFVPLLLLFAGEITTCATVIAFFSECLVKDSHVNKYESTWLFYMINIKLSCLVGIIGFAGLIIDLQLMLDYMTQ